MKKTIIIAAVAMLSIGLSSCIGDNGFNIDGSQNLSKYFSAYNIAMVSTGQVLKNHPDLLDDSKKIADVFRSLAENESISKADIIADVERAIINSKSSHKQELLITVNAIIDSAFSSEQISLAKHKQTFIDIANGIDSAIRIHLSTLSK